MWGISAFRLGVNVISINDVGVYGLGSLQWTMTQCPHSCRPFLQGSGGSCVTCLGWWPISPSGYWPAEPSASRGLVNAWTSSHVLLEGFPWAPSRRAEGSPSRPVQWMRKACPPASHVRCLREVFLGVSPRWTTSRCDCTSDSSTHHRRWEEPPTDSRN